MPKDFLSLVRRPADLLKALRNITLGGAIATTGVSTGLSADSAQPRPPQPSVTPMIVDKVKKGAKLVLQLPGAVTGFSAQHRSHRSHSSHRSHYSSSGGGTTAPPPTRPTPPPPRPSPSGALDLIEAVSGEIVKIDTATRTITIREASKRESAYEYRDDSRFEAISGIRFRFDDYIETNPGRLPIAVGDKVSLAWRASPNGRTRIIDRIWMTPRK